MSVDNVSTYVEGNGGAGDEAGMAGGGESNLVTMATPATNVAEFAVLSTEAVGSVVICKASHTPDTALGAVLILLEAIVQVRAGAVADRLSWQLVGSRCQFLNVLASIGAWQPSFPSNATRRFCYRPT